MKLLSTTTGKVHLAKAKKINFVAGPTVLNLPACIGVRVSGHIVSLPNHLEFEGEASEITCKKCAIRAQRAAERKVA